VRDGGAYGCAVPRAYANLNPGLFPRVWQLEKDLNAATESVMPTS